MGKTNYKNSEVEIDLYSSSGLFLDKWVTTQMGGQIELRLDQPPGDYELGLRDAGALPCRVRVRYDASGIVYDLRLSYGDIDGDGDIDSADHKWVARWQGLTKQNAMWETVAFKEAGRPIFPWIADFNADSRIDADDRRILESNLGKRSP